jgi:hypothetical protein
MKKVKAARLCLLVAVSVILWFVAVDKSFFLEGCRDCGYERDTIRYRILTIPIHKTPIEQHSPVEVVADALGAPCPHKDWYVVHKYRWWGLVFCACPCERGTTGLIYEIDSWYDDSLREKLREASERNSTLGEEFRQRVVYKQDWNYWRRFQLEVSDSNKEQIVLEGSNLSESRLREIADRIQLIKWVKLEPGVVQPDDNAMVVIALGRTIGRQLVERVTDEQPSNWISWACVGDVAHMLLGVIYDRYWPTSDFTRTEGISETESFPTDYLGFVKSSDAQRNSENRRKLQDAWRNVVAGEM